MATSTDALAAQIAKAVKSTLPKPKAPKAKKPKAVGGPTFSVPKKQPPVLPSGMAKRLKLAPAPKKPKGIAGGASAPAAAKPWYDPSNTTARDASIAAALADPLKPVTGQAAVDLARALSQSSTAGILSDYDRQASSAQSLAANQGARQATGTDQLRAQIAAQLAGQQASQAKARDQIAGAGAGLQASIDQGTQQAAAAAAQDAATRGGGLDGGSAAQRAQEAANAKARGQAGSSIALDQQAGQAASGDALLQQISAATAQQGGERQGQITNSLNTQLRNVNEGRSKTLAAGEQQFLKTIMDLQSQNIQTNLATETLGLNKEKASADTAIKTAQLDQQAKIAKLNAQIKVTEGAEQRALRKQLQSATDKQRALDRAARTSTADANRSSADSRAAAALAARKKKDAASGTGAAKLTTQDKDRRKLITNIKSATVSGQFSALRKKAKSAPEFRQLLLDEVGVKDFLSRSIITDLQYGGLRSNTIKGYKAKYGRNPPKEWKRYKAPKAKPAGGALGIANGVANGTT